MNRSGYLGMVALLAGISATGAFAQDDAVNWTGFYAGFGLAKQRTAMSFENPNLSSSLSLSLAIGATGSSESNFLTHDVTVDQYVPSLLAGYGKELDNGLYLGLEAEANFMAPATVSASDVYGTIDCASVDVCATSANFASLQTLGRLRAIFGISPSSSFLLFGSAGIALAKGSAGATAYAQAPGQQDTEQSSATSYLVGATVGAGVEVRATDNLIIRLEGAVDAYPTTVDASSVTATAHAAGSGSTADSTITYSGSTKFADAMVRAALIWQF